MRITLTLVIEEKFYKLVEVTSVAFQFDAVVVVGDTHVTWVPAYIHHLQQQVGCCSCN